MAFTTHPIAPPIRALIDGVSVGALKSFSERCANDLTLLRELGSQENAAYHRGGAEYFVELKYALPLGYTFVDEPSDPAALQNFVLSIQLPNRTLRFFECVSESVETSCEAGGELICTMRIYARRRECIREMG